MRKLIAVIVLFFLLTGFISPQKEISALPNIFVFVIFGLNAEESNETLLPYIFGEFKNSSYYYPNMHFTKGFDFHIPIFKNILTGYTALSRAGTKETYMTKLIKQYGIDKSKMLIASHWTNTQIVKKKDFHAPTTPNMITIRFDNNFGFSEDIYSDYQTFLRRKTLVWPHWDTHSRIYQPMFMSLLKKYKPKFVATPLNAPESAHFGLYSRYANSLLMMDSQFKTIVNFLKNDPFYKDNTYIFLVPDHQRNANYQHHNEAYFKGKSKIWLMVNGPGLPPETSTRKVTHSDIYKTILKMTGLVENRKDISGSVLTELFE